MEIQRIRDYPEQLNANKMDIWTNTISQDWISAHTEILSSVTKWMSLEGTMLSKIRQILYTFTYTQNLKNKTNEQTYKTSIVRDTKNKQMVSGVAGAGKGGK